jgi:uncharacterized protein
MRPLLPLVIVALAAAPATAAAQATPPNPEPRTISVSGSAFVTQANDVARFTVGVAVRRPTAAAALSAASTRARAVLRAVTAGGVAASDVKSGRISVTRVARRAKGTRPRLVGYAAHQTFEVVVRRIDRAGAIVGAAVRAGANEVSGPRFELSDPDEAYARALTAALARARVKAQRLATAAGMTLGAPRTITESGAYVASDADTATLRSAAGGATPPVRPGEARVEASVTVEYEMVAPS